MHNVDLMTFNRTVLCKKAVLLQNSDHTTKMDRMVMLTHAVYTTIIAYRRSYKIDIIREKIK